jgi:MFS family permease
MSDIEKSPEKDTSANDGSERIGTILKHADRNDADEALKVLQGENGEVIELTPEDEKRLLRKIDWNLMPLLCLVYGLNYLDKTTISYASVMGLKKDIGLSGNQYSWIGSMFYFGYLFWEYPTNRLLQRLPLGKWSAFNVIMWGLILCCMAATKNFAGAMTVRFFLGVFEAAVTRTYLPSKRKIGACTSIPSIFKVLELDTNTTQPGSLSLPLNGTPSRNKVQGQVYGSPSTAGARSSAALSPTGLRLGQPGILWPSSRGSFCSWS